MTKKTKSQAPAPTMAEQIATKDATEQAEARASLQHTLDRAQSALNARDQKREEWEQGILSIDKLLTRRVVLTTGGPQIEIRAEYQQGNAPDGKQHAAYDELVRASIVYIGWFDRPHAEIQISATKYPDLWEWLEMLGENDG